MMAHVKDNLENNSLIAYLIKIKPKISPPLTRKKLFTIKKNHLFFGKGGTSVFCKDLGLGLEGCGNSFADESSVLMITHD